VKKPKQSGNRITIHIGGDAKGANITAIGGSVQLHAQPTPSGDAALFEPRTPLQKQLYEVLRKRFTLEELENISFELGIAFDNLGVKSRDSAARALVYAAAQHNLERKLAELVARERPGAIKLQ